MSDYEDEDEPLHARPLQPPHKAGLVPRWAGKTGESDLRAALAAQAATEPASIFASALPASLFRFSRF